MMSVKNLATVLFVLSGLLSLSSTPVQAGIRERLGFKKNQTQVQKAQEQFRNAAQSGSHTPAEIQAAAAKVHNRIQRKDQSVDMNFVMGEHARGILAVKKAGHSDLAAKEEKKLADYERTFNPGVRTQKKYVGDAGVAHHESAYVRKISNDRIRTKAEEHAVVQHFTVNPLMRQFPKVPTHDPRLGSGSKAHR